MKEDIVYILKQDISSDEIKYSLRSVAENMPGHRVVFYCGCPKDIKPDLYVKHTQTGALKWQRSTSSLVAICKNDDLTEDFFLFNDDFYVLEPQEGEFINLAFGSIEDRIRDLRTRHTDSGYIRQLVQMEQELLRKGFPTVNYALHVPMLVNRKKALEVLSSAESPMFRCMYGNMTYQKYKMHEDVKIYDLETVPGAHWDFLSSADNTFKNGKVGQWVRERFPNPSPWEVVS